MPSSLSVKSSLGPPTTRTQQHEINKRYEIMIRKESMMKGFYSELFKLLGLVGLLTLMRGCIDAENQTQDRETEAMMQVS